MEDPDGVGSAADARSHRVGQPAVVDQDLRAGLHADHPVEVADHLRERVGPGDRAQQVVGVGHVGDPVAHGLVDGVLEGLGPGGHRDDLSTQQLHPGHVEGLPAGVLQAHVDHAVQAHQGGCRRGGHPVLAGPGLGDHPALAHPDREQGLAQDVVDLVRAGVVEVLALEHDTGADPACGGEPGRLGEGGRPAGVGAGQVIELGEELRVHTRRRVGSRQLVQGGDQRLRDEATAEHAEVPGGIGRGCGPRDEAEVGQVRGHGRPWRNAGWAPAVTRSCTACRGSPPVTRLSPTSTASAPALA